MKSGERCFASYVNVSETWMDGSVQAQIGIFCGQDIGNVTSYAPTAAPSEHVASSSLYVKGVARNGSPPWRDDNKDGHYVFELGENITSRCNYTLSIINCSFTL